MKLLMFAASLRKESFNKKLITVAEKIATEKGVTVDNADFAEFNMPLYNADIQDNEGFPTVVTDFVARMQATDGVVIASPEYNYSTPGTLKNVIDWVSRLRPIPWKNVPILLMSASISTVGGNRGLWATRVPLEACGAHLYPDMFSLAIAQTAFEDKTLKDPELHKRLAQNMQDFIAYTKALRA
jgi:chromate reductase